MDLNVSLIGIKGFSHYRQRQKENGKTATKSNLNIDSHSSYSLENKPRKSRKRKQDLVIFPLRTVIMMWKPPLLFLEPLIAQCPCGFIVPGCKHVNFVWWNLLWSQPLVANRGIAVFFFGHFSICFIFNPEIWRLSNPKTTHS